MQVVGDLSFLHDINGLSLLRAGEARPPLTVVLVNNGGGGIFSFLPIAASLPEQQFTQLWATPQNVDLEGARASVWGGEGRAARACPLTHRWAPL